MILVVRSSVLTPEFDKKHLKKAGGPIGRNVVNIKIKNIVRKLQMIKKNICLKIIDI